MTIMVGFPVNRFFYRMRIDPISWSICMNLLIENNMENDSSLCCAVMALNPDGTKLGLPVAVSQTLSRSLCTQLHKLLDLLLSRARFAGSRECILSVIIGGFSAFKRKGCYGKVLNILFIEYPYTIYKCNMVTVRKSSR